MSTWKPQHTDWLFVWYTLILELLAVILPICTEKADMNLPGVRIGFGVALVPFLLLLIITFPRHRWQFIGSDVLAVMVLVIVAVPLSTRDLNTKGKRAAVIACSAIFGLFGALFNYLLPVWYVPPLSGPHAVASATFSWTDKSRPGFLTTGIGSDEHREIMVQIFYPASKKSVVGKTKETYYSDLKDILVQLAPAFARPFVSHAFLVKSWAYSASDVPILPPQDGEDKKLPVILFSHGYTGTRGLGRTMFEELASHGYVVVACDHSYDATFTFIPGLESGSARTFIGFHAKAPEGTAGSKLYRFRNEHIRVRSADLRFIIDSLELMQAGRGEEIGGRGYCHWKDGIVARDPANNKHIYDQFEGRLRLGPRSIGVFGHSMGGGTVVQACAEDPRVACVLGLDAWLYCDSHYIFAGKFKSDFEPEPLPGVPEAQGPAGVPVPLLLIECPLFLDESEPWTHLNRLQSHQLLLLTSARHEDMANTYFTSQPRHTTLHLSPPLGGEDKEQEGRDNSDVSDHDDSHAGSQVGSSSSSSSSAAVIVNSNDSNNDHYSSLAATEFAVQKKQNSPTKPSKQEDKRPLLLASGSTSTMRNNSHAFHILVRDSAHQDWIEVQWAAPLILKLAKFYTMEPYHSHTIQRALVSGFFDHYLKSDPSCAIPSDSDENKIPWWLEKQSIPRVCDPTIPQPFSELRITRTPTPINPNRA